MQDDIIIIEGDEEELEELQAQLAAVQEQLLEDLSNAVAAKRKEAVSGRQQSGIEVIWAEDEDSYEGIDDANREEQVLGNSKSKSYYEGTYKKDTRKGSNVFLNITRPYCDAAAARVADMLLPTDDRNWAVKATPIPEIDRLMPLAEQGIPEVQEAVMAFEAELAEAEEAAKAAERQIEDWLVECNYHHEARKGLEDCARIGTGILKGPFPVVRDDEIKPVSKVVSPWDFYPDPACGDNIQNGEYVLERDSISARQLRDLAEDPTYLSDQIEIILKEGPGKRNADDHTHKPVKDNDQFEVWYFYGDIKASELQACGCEVDSELEVVNAVVTMINDRVIRASESPLDCGDFPFDVIPWQRRNDHWSGIGVARQIRSAQRIVNAATRNMLDNAGMAAGPMIISKKGVVEPTNGIYEIAPRKHWIVKEESDIQNVQAAFAPIQIPMFQGELLEIVHFAIKIAENVTGLPMLMQGDMGKAPDSVGGMQLLNNNANTVLRRIARSYDDYITEPHIRRYYKWIMSYGPAEAQGDLNIDARGSSALVERDVQNQAIMQMGPMIQNPAFEISPKKWIQEWLKSQRLDPNRFVLDDEEKQEMQKMMQNRPPPPEMMKMQAEMEKVKVQTQAEMQKEQLRQQSDMAELQFKAKEAELQRQFEFQLKQMDLQMKAMEYAQKRQMELEKVKVDLQKFAHDLKTKKELQANEIAVKQQYGQGL